MWRYCAVVITNPQFDWTKPKLRFCAVSNPTAGKSEISQCTWGNFLHNCFLKSLHILCYIDIFQQSFSLKLRFWIIQKFEIFGFYEKWPTLSSKNINYILARLLRRLLWNKFAKIVPICVLKNSVELFMSKVKFFLN